MPVAHVFRTLLVTDAVLTTTSIAAVMLGPDTAAAQSSDSLAHILSEGAVLLAWLIALIGLWQLRSWARFLYVTVAAIGLAGTFLLADGVATGTGKLLSAACWMVTGVIIALMYWSAIAPSFRARHRAA